MFSKYKYQISITIPAYITLINTAAEAIARGSNDIVVEKSVSEETPGPLHISKCPVQRVFVSIIYSGQALTEIYLRSGGTDTSYIKPMIDDLISKEANISASALKKVGFIIAGAMTDD